MSSQSIALTFGVVGCIKLLDLLVDRVFVQCKRLRHDGRGRVFPDFFEDVVMIHTERRHKSYLVSRPAGIFVESWVVVSDRSSRDGSARSTRQILHSAFLLVQDVSTMIDKTSRKLRWSILSRHVPSPCLSPSPRTCHCDNQQSVYQSQLRIGSTIDDLSGDNSPPLSQTLW